MIDLDNLARLEAAATPAPWSAGSSMCCPDMGWVDGPAGTGKVCPQYQGTKTTHTLDAYDAELIAEMRNALRPLLADHARLVAEVARLTESGRLAVDLAEGCQAEVARLRGLLDRAASMLEANTDKSSRRFVAAAIRKEAAGE